MQNVVRLARKPEQDDVKPFYFILPVAAAILTSTELFD
jgi:hypothetical protein